MSKLTELEKERLQKGIQAALATPFIDDVEDYIWEAIWAYTKGISLRDTLSSIRSKRLFDVIDLDHHVGWSAKALQWGIVPGTSFELVIQRADIFKKHEALGFDHLSIDSPPDMLGSALLKHWYDKVTRDAQFQEVIDRRICILLKSRDRRRFTVYEDT